MAKHNESGMVEKRGIGIWIAHGVMILGVLVMKKSITLILYLSE